MLFTNEDMKQPLDLSTFDALPVDESGIPDVYTLPIGMSEDKSKIIISLENAVHFCGDHECGIDDIINELARLNEIPTSRVAISVRPSSLSFHESYRSIYQTLKENGVSVYINDMPYTRENTLLETVIQECLDTGSMESLDVLSEGVFGNIRQSWNAIKQGGLGGVVRGAGDMAVQAGRSAMTAGLQGVQSGITKGTSNIINNKIFGRLDSAQGPEREVYNPATGKMEKRQNIVKNGAVHDMMRNKLNITNGSLHDLADETINGLRNNVSSDITHKLWNAFGLASNRINPENMQDAVNRQIRYYTNRWATGADDPQKRGMIQKVLDKLKQLKDRIAARFRGQTA